MPNFSEGRNEETIEAIAGAIRGTAGCTLLDVEPGASTNRTVYTYVGDPQAVIEGALNAARMAGKHIDMTRHEGEHPRFGALDVCPFIPVSNVTMADCVAIAETFGRRLSEELGVPVFLYEQAAKEPYRRKLPDVRRGRIRRPGRTAQRPPVANLISGLLNSSRPGVPPPQVHETS